MGPIFKTSAGCAKCQEQIKQIAILEAQVAVWKSDCLRLYSQKRPGLPAPAAEPQRPPVSPSVRCASRWRVITRIYLALHALLVAAVLIPWLLLYLGKPGLYEPIAPVSLLDFLYLAALPVAFFCIQLSVIIARSQSGMETLRYLTGTLAIIPVGWTLVALAIFIAAFPCS